MYDGLWTAKFRASGGQGGGVVVLVNGKVLGGDSQFAYIGTYREAAPDQMEATIRCGQFNKIPGMQSVFGPLSNFEVHLKGQAGAHKIVLYGYMKAQPSARIELELTKTEDLAM